MMLMKMSAKNFFFDKKIVIRKIGEGKSIFFNRAGAIVRGNARRLVRYAKKAKPHPSPGPPRSRVTGDEFGLRNIIYSYSMEYGGMMVGPVGKEALWAVPVPSRHEHGRGARIKIPLGRRRKVVMKYVDYPIRPFMKPALAMATPKLPGLWKNSVRA